MEILVLCVVLFQFVCVGYVLSELRLMKITMEVLLLFRHRSRQEKPSLAKPHGIRDPPTDPEAHSDHAWQAEITRIQSQLHHDQQRHNIAEILPFLFLGDRYATYDLSEGINPCGITQVINVSDNFQSPAYPEHLHLTTHNFPMHDEYEPNFLTYLMQIIEIVNHTKERKERILIHCKHGRNRSVAIIAGFLLHEGYVSTLSQALNMIKKRIEKHRINTIAPRLQYIKTLFKFEHLATKKVKSSRSRRKTKHHPSEEHDEKSQSPPHKRARSQVVEIPIVQQDNTK